MMKDKSSSEKSVATPTKPKKSIIDKVNHWIFTIIIAMVISFGASARMHDVSKGMIHDVEDRLGRQIAQQQQESLERDNTLYKRQKALLGALKSIDNYYFNEIEKIIDMLSDSTQNIKDVNARIVEEAKIQAKLDIIYSRLIKRMDVKISESEKRTWERQIKEDLKEFEVIYTKLLYPAVKIETNYGVGSGVVIYSKNGETYVLTAAHVIEEVYYTKYMEVAQYPSIKFYDYKTRRTLATIGDILVYNSRLDYAIIKIKYSDIKYHSADIMSEREMRNVKIGKPISIVGCKLGGPMWYSRGYVSVNYDNQYGTAQRKWGIESSIIYGNSGGPVYIDNKLAGIAISMNVAKGPLHSGQTWMTPIHSIMEDCRVKAKLLKLKLPFLQ